MWTRKQTNDEMAWRKEPIQRQHTHNETLSAEDTMKREREKGKIKLFLINKFIWNEEQQQRSTYTHMNIKQTKKKVVILLNPNKEQIKWWWWTSEWKKSRNRQTWIEKKKKITSYRQISITFIGSNTQSTHTQAWFICCRFHNAINTISHSLCARLPLCVCLY